MRAQTDAIWERFITLTLERILSERLREFLDGMEAELQELDQRLVGTDCEVDRLRGRVQERRRGLEEKIAVLEPLAHRTSAQNHIGMMLSRVEGLEAYLLGKKDVTPEAYEMHYKRHTTAPGDLLYLRVRLLTTRIAIIASNRSKHLSESVLKAIPGVGNTICARLIKEFGSVEEIRLKTPEELAKIDGVSLALAEKIIAKLNENGAPNTGEKEENSDGRE